MNKKQLLILLCFIFFIQQFKSGLKAQDIHFSQFYASPLTLNPAYTGDYDGDFRIMNSYRTQWMSKFGTPFTTNGFGYDRQIYLFNEHLSAGIVWVQDKSGDAQLKVTKINISAAYHRTISQNNLSVGFQVGYVQKNFNLDKLSFPNQYNNNPDNIGAGLFDTNKDSKEKSNIYDSDQLSYMDMSLGIGWSRRFNKLQPKVGFALYHINQPKESFFKKDSNNLPMREVLDLSATYDLTPKMFLMPKILFMAHSGATDLLFGSNLGYRIRENKYTIKSVFGGILFRSGFDRNTDALIYIAGVNFTNVDVGFSFDQNISELRTATNQFGAFEISIIYTGMSTVLKKIAIPCDRY